jgi:hypothetical protein
MAYDKKSSNVETQKPVNPPPPPPPKPLQLTKLCKRNTYKEPFHYLIAVEHSREMGVWFHIHTCQCLDNIIASFAVVLFPAISTHEKLAIHHHLVMQETTEHFTQKKRGPDFKNTHTQRYNQLMNSLRSRVSESFKK